MKTSIQVRTSMKRLQQELRLTPHPRDERLPGGRAPTPSRRAARCRRERRRAPHCRIERRHRAHICRVPSRCDGQRRDGQALRLTPHPRDERRRREDWLAPRPHVPSLGGHAHRGQRRHQRGAQATMMLLQQQNTTHTTDSSPRSRDRMVHTPEGMALQEVIPSSALISMSARPRVWPASLPAAQGQQTGCPRRCPRRCPQRCPQRKTASDQP